MPLASLEKVLQSKASPRGAPEWTCYLLALAKMLSVNLIKYDHKLIDLIGYHEYAVGSCILTLTGASHYFLPITCSKDPTQRIHGCVQHGSATSALFPMPLGGQNSGLYGLGCYLVAHLLPCQACSYSYSYS